ncbi:MAG: hypothetical protein N3D77_13460, partial [Geminicoccaceae bacterium]|nr:hypothetical protein [Geminicoccaceae bacterium]
MALLNLAASAGSGPGAATARSLARRAAEAGHPQARALLGSLLAAGIGGPPEPDAAEHWYREVAGAGDPAAALGLGCLLLARSSADASRRREALDWLERAARAGIAPGNTLARAQSLADPLLVLPREPLREQALLERLAATLSTFTPQVYIHAARASLIAEVAASLRLFGGIEALCEA